MQGKGFTPRGHAPSTAPNADLPAPVVPAAFAGEIDPFVHGNEIEIDAPFDPASMVVDTRVTMFGNFVEPARALWQLTRTLTAADLRDPVAFHCRAALLQEADGGEARLRYEVTPPIGDKRESELLRLRIRKGAQLPPEAPWVEGTVGNQGRELRMDDLAFRDVTVIVEGHTGNAGDTIVVSYTPVEGEAFESPPQTLPADGLPLTFTVPYLTANASPGRVIVSYVLTRPGQAGIESRTRTLQVTAATAPPPLLAPIVVEADAEGRVDPLGVDTVHGQIPATATIPPGVWLRLTWEGNTPGGSFTTTEEAPTPGMTIAIDMGVLAHNAGQSVQLTYTLVGPTDERVSEMATITVHPITDDSAALPRPTFSQANDDVLDMESFVGDKAQVVIDRYRLAADYQHYWLTLSGKRTDGSDLVLVIATARPITNSGSPILLLGDVPRADLEQFADGSPIVLVLKLTFDQSTDIAHAVRFRQTTLTIRQAGSTRYTAPTLKEAGSDGSIDPLRVPSLTGRLPGDVQFGATDTVDITWRSHSGQGDLTLHIETPAPGLEIPFPLHLLCYAFYETVALSYVVNRGEAQIVSDTCTLRVGGVPSYSPLLPPPEVTEAVDGVLDLTTFEGDAHATLPLFPLYFPGQRHWTSVRGDRGYEISNGEALEGTGPQLALGTMPRQLLEQSRDGSEILLLLALTFDANPNPLYGAVLFPFARFTVRTGATR